MKKKLILAMTFVLALFLFVPTSFANTIADGTYTVPYTIQTPNGSASIADRYFTGSAKVTVTNGSAVADLTVTSGEYVKSVSSSSGGELINDSGDTKVYRIPFGNITESQNLSMHISVPEEIAKMEYDTTHTTVINFDTSSLPTASSETSQNEQKSNNQSSNEQGTSNQGTNDGSGNKEIVENPKTSDETPLLLYVFLMAASVAGFMLYRKRFANN